MTSQRVRHPKRISIHKDRNGRDPYVWYFTVEHDPINLDEESLDYGSLETWREAFDAACSILASAPRCPKCNTTRIASHPDRDGRRLCYGCGHDLAETPEEPS